MKFKAVPIAVFALMVVTGCRVQVDKDKNGQEKSVKVDTPLGAMHVQTNNTSAADMGLPVYPGAKVTSGDGDSKSADVHVGVGPWQLRVKVVNYQTQDSEDKVIDFYRKALGRYGDVIECRGSKPVGTPTATREGLTCEDKGSSHHSQVQISSDRVGLKAGSERRQHLMEIKRSGVNGTDFTLVALELPGDMESPGESQ